MSKKHQHYFKNVEHLTHIDIYRIIDLYAIHDPCLQHAFKKIACAGQRGAKDQAKDVQEAIDTLLRWKEMQEENKAGEPTKAAWTEDKELPSSGIYGDNGYTEDDLKAASLVHDFEQKQSAANPITQEIKDAYKACMDGIVEFNAAYNLDDALAKAKERELVALCSNTTIHADADGWIAHHGNSCPVSDETTVVDIVTNGLLSDTDQAAFFEWDSIALDKCDVIKYWRYHKAK